MSNNGKPAISISGAPSAAAEVSFSRLADQRGESSSRAASRSSGKQSSKSHRDRGKDEERDEMGDGHSTGDHSSSNPSAAVSSLGHRSRRSGGFLLESPVANGSLRENGSALDNRNGKRKALNGLLPADKKRLADTRLSADSSLGGSPLSREVSMDSAPVDISYDGRQLGPRPQSMDAAQLVQMALSLGESRRRHVSGPLHVPLSSSTGVRVVSGRDPYTGPMRAKTPRTQQQGHRSDETAPSPRAAEVPVQRHPDDVDDSAATIEDTFIDPGAFNFSPATLSRAEKARKYLELADEYRRLLQYLPPLKPDATSPGNYVHVSTPSLGSPHHSDISRVASHANEKYQLGRSYNPLQALRNRRLRTRERRPLIASPESWTDVESVTHWINQVELTSNRSRYRLEGDQVNLPTFDGDAGSVNGLQDSTKGHRRTDTVNSVITRPENGWSIEPSELLADTYWTESNKSLIENRRGVCIFHSSDNMLKNSTAALRENGNVTTPGANGNGSEGYRSHQRRHLLHRPHRRLPRISRSGSSSSEGSADDVQATAHDFNADAGEDDIGPLQRHMQEMIAKEERGEPLSPELLSPDHWDPQPIPISTSKEDLHRDSRNRANEGLTVDTQFQHRRSRSADARFGAGTRARSGNYDLVTRDHSSPVFAVPDLIPSIGGDLTPPTSRRSEKQKSKPHRLPIFRSYTKEANHIGQADFADNIAHADLESATERDSMDSLRPGQSLPNRPANSHANSLRRLNTAGTSTMTTDRSIKDSGSGVGRFLKAGRIGDLVRNEGSRLGDRFRGRDKVDGSSALESASMSDEKMERRMMMSADSLNESSPQDTPDRGRLRPHFNLPSFTSPSVRSKQQRPSSADAGPLSQREIVQETYRTPPHIILPEVDLPYLSEGSAMTLDNRHRKSYGFLDQGMGSSASSPFASLSDLRSSQFTAQARRHWSISDKARPEQASKVAMRDVARARALLLSSGIKARELQRRADTTREQPLPLMVLAAESADQPLPQVARKEEHLAVARLLSEAIASTTSQFQAALTRFQNDTARSLGTRIDELRHRAAEQLTVRVHDTSDDADAFDVELTTKQPQDLKRVDDAIDAMLRRRRRQFRLIRRAGFKLLEWLVLGIMWGVWLVVVIFNTFKRVGLGVLALLRWLLWF